MKKLTLLLALLLCFSLFAGCDDETARGGDTEIPGYPVSMDADGWEAAKAEDTNYDLEMNRDGVTMILWSFSALDFVDLPTAEELFDDCNSQLLNDYTEGTEKKAPSTSTSDGRTTMTALFSVKDGETTKYIRTYLVEFDSELGARTWVAFIGEKSAIEDDKDDFDDMVNSLSCDLKALAAQIAADEPLFDEEGNIVTEPPVDYEETPEEETSPAPTNEGDAGGTPEFPETPNTDPVETTPATTAPAETTPATTAAA